MAHMSAICVIFKKTEVCLFRTCLLRHALVKVITLYGSYLLHIHVRNTIQS
jgi:hypothetical protein